MTSRHRASAAAARRPFSNKELLVVVLGAGRGQRMKSAAPKILHRLAGEPLIAYPLGLVRALGAAKVVVVHSPGQAAELSLLCESCVLVPQENPRGTGDALNQVPHSLRGAREVLVLYGDVPLLTLASVKALLQARRRRDLDCALLASRFRDPTGYGRVIVANGNPRIVEEADASREEAAVDLVNTGVCCFSGAALWPALRKLRRSSATGELYLTEVFGLLPNRTVVECPEEEAMGINDRWQLAVAERVVRERINRAHAEAGVTIVDPATTYIDAAVRIEPDALIQPFTFLRGQTSIGSGSRIGPFAEIEDCRIGRGATIGRSHLVGSTVEDEVTIGPFNRLRQGSVIARSARIGSYAEIKNTLVGPDSDVHHFSYLGDAVLGQGVNIGAGTVTANYDGLEKRQTLIGDGVFVGSDTILVAPVGIGDGAYTAAGSVITHDVEPGSLAIERSDQRDIRDWARRRKARTAERGSKRAPGS
jgi:bifunctional UDP-N-acetylglucosamine pyrophosphorylase/glucosamine-1-phosphate N-acetyltransferase